MRVTGRSVVSAAAVAILAGGTGAGASTLDLYRAAPSMSMNEQTTSYETVVRDAVQSRFLGYSDLQTDLQDKKSRFWLNTEGRYVDFQATGAHGVYGAFFAGFDVRITPDLTLGMFGGYTETDSDLVVEGVPGWHQAKGFGIGGYGGYRLGAGLALNGFVTYTATGYDIEQGDGFASPDADRLTGGLGIQASYGLGSLTFSPFVGVSVTHEWQDGYVDTVGTVAAGEDVTLFRGVLGGQLGTTLSYGGTEISPYVSAALEGTADDIGSASKVDDGVSGRIGAGFAMPVGDLLFRVSGDISGLGARDFIDAGGYLTLTYALD